MFLFLEKKSQVPEELVGFGQSIFFESLPRFAPSKNDNWSVTYRCFLSLKNLRIRSSPLQGNENAQAFFSQRENSLAGVVPGERNVQKWSDVFFLTNISHAIWRNAFSNSTPLLFEQCSGGRLKKKNWGILRPKDWERVYILLFLLVGLKPTRSSSWLLQRCEMMRWFIHEAENELNTTRLLQAMIHCSKGSMLRSSICQQTNINKSMRLCEKKKGTVFNMFWDLYPLHPWFQSPPWWHHILKGKAAIPNLNLLPLASFLASWAWGLGPKYVRHG